MKENIKIDCKLYKSRVIILNHFSGILNLIMPGERGYGEYPTGNANSYRIVVSLFCMINGILMLIDCILAYRRK